MLPFSKWAALKNVSNYTTSFQIINHNPLKVSKISQLKAQLHGHPPSIILVGGRRKKKEETSI